MEHERSGTIEERLDDLEEESRARHAELRAVLDSIPPAVSRRALVASAVRDLRETPRRWRLPVVAVRRLAEGLGRRARRATSSATDRR
ncbi:hypothetical protein [Ilumatobacter sp.]|uniref:hypothetical protein n=1 Tax=Ilumatobacter sp. TaxID=1967498 RepID=UPI003B515C98